MRIGYFAGPGDVCSTYIFWKRGIPDPNETSITYSSQFFDLAREFEACAYVVSSNYRSDIVEDGGFIIKNCPFINTNAGLLYVWSDFLYSGRILYWLLRQKLDVLIWFDSISPWLLIFAKLLRVKVVLSAHCVPADLPVVSRLRWVRLILNRFSYSRACSAILCVSREVAFAFERLYGVSGGKICVFSPSMRLINYLPPEIGSGFDNQFNILFVGRVVGSKGVFDLLQAVQDIPALIEKNIVVRYCGGGPDIDELSRRALTSSRATVEILGHCQYSKVQESFLWASVVVVPTRLEFNEGFNKVVAEAASFGVPVIATSVCPAVRFFPDSILSVPPNSPGCLSEALLSLILDRDLRDRLSRGGKINSQEFLKSSLSWGRALRQVLSL